MYFSTREKRKNKFQRSGKRNKKFGKSDFGEELTLVFPGWVDGIDEKIINFLSTLQVDQRPGRYLPCLIGATTEGKKVSLGFSCFALKIYHMLGQWKNLDENYQNSWITFIKSFQNVGSVTPKNSIKKNGFLDPTLIDFLESKKTPFSFRSSIKKLLKPPQPEFLNNVERAVIAETKQALSTLAEVDKYSTEPYNWFPKTPKAVSDYMGKFDWSQPWDAGGQTAALPVFFSLEARRIMQVSEVKDLQKATSEFFESIVDSETGGYFIGPPPNHGMLINGAMKVLTALAWLEEPIHFPEKLIDTTLKLHPRTEGCHLADAVYVLHRCSSQTDYNRDQIMDYFLSVVDIINKHHNEDGGFSYNVESTQTSYYGLPISKGLNESDIHGTVLLTWALAMIFDFADAKNFPWAIIKP